MSTPAATQNAAHARATDVFRVFIFTLLLSGRAAHAQLANSFYNLTSVETKILSNAVQVTIRADGLLIYGADYAEITESGTDYYRPRALTSLRLRFLRARSRLPAFINIGLYPIDAISIEPARTALQNPFFGSGSDVLEPKTDLVVRFFTPVMVRDFEPANWDALPFGNYLNPLDVRVEYGDDGQSVVITAVSDRADANRIAPAPSPTPVAAEQKTRVLITPHTKPLPDTPQSPKWRIEALHTPLAALLDAVTNAMSTPAAAIAISADAEVAAQRVSLHLPDANLEEFLTALSNGNDFVVSRSESGAWRIARGLPSTPDSASLIERLPLQNLSAERARNFFPDFLLPYIRADKENNALLIAGSPRLIARVRRDLSTLDVPRPLVRVEATAWEIASTVDLNRDLQFQTTQGNTSIALDTSKGQFSLQIDESNAEKLSTGLQALSQRGQARLAARPFLVVASGENGSLFLGQDRFITVLQNAGGQQNVNALRLSIGYALNVRPVVGGDGSILLEINPRLSTVDSIEDDSGLPTLGIRETSSTLRLSPGDSILLGGLDSDLQFNSKRRDFFGTKRDNREQTSLLIIVTARSI